MPSIYPLSLRVDLPTGEACQQPYSGPPKIRQYVKVCFQEKKEAQNEQGKT